MSAPETEDETTIVTGPESLVNQVAQAAATIDVSGRTEDVDQAVRLAPRDNRGILIQGVNLDPPITDVLIEVEQERFSRSMAVSPDIVGAPADGYNVASVSVNPPAVTVRGDEAYISGTVSVATKPVDIAGTTDDVVQTVSLDLPKGAEVTGGVPVVTVTIRIEPGQGISTMDIPISATGLGDGVRIEGALPTAVVSLAGEQPLLNSLAPNDVLATLDLSGKGAGVHTVPVRVTVPEGINVRSATPSEVQITLVGN
jgi:YbbR domain-containing protein